MSRIESNMSGDQGQEGGAAGVVQSLKDKASDVAQSLSDMGGKVKEQAAQQYENLRDSASEYYEAGRQKAVQWQENVEQYVREQPMKAVAIAAGVGVVLGFLFRRL